MKVEVHKHTQIVKDTQGDLTAFVMKLTHEHKTFEGKNLAIDLTSYAKLSKKQLLEFAPLCILHKNGNKSFVIIHPSADFTALPNKLVVVPTKQEALDIIELDEIERDLGF